MDAAEAGNAEAADMGEKVGTADVDTLRGGKARTADQRQESKIRRRGRRIERAVVGTGREVKGEKRTVY